MVHSPNSKECHFCCLSSNSSDTKMIYEDEFCFAVNDKFPVSRGHLLLIPKDHIVDWFSDNNIIQNHLISVLNKLKKELNARYLPDGYNVGMNCGEIAGQSILHLHIHLIPRYKGDMKNPKGGVRGVIPQKQNY